MFITLGSRAGRRRLAATGGSSGGSSTGREALTANRTYYVRTDGSDISNNGLSDHSGGAFATVQKALNVAATIDFNGFTVTVQAGSGSFSGAVDVGLMTGQSTAANLVITGISAAATTITASRYFQGTIRVTGAGARVTLQNMTVANTDGAGGICIMGLSNAEVAIGNDVTVSSTFSWLWAQTGASVYLLGGSTLTVALNATYPFFSAAAGLLSLLASTTVALGTRTGTALWRVAELGYGESQATYTGTFTGKKYDILTNGVMQTFGATLPGSSAGTTTTGGQVI